MSEEEKVTCPQCDTLCKYAPAIGHYCPNKKCNVRDNIHGHIYDDFYFALESFHTEAQTAEELWSEINIMKFAISKLEKQANNVRTQQDAINFVQSFKKFALMYIEDKWRL